MYVLRLTADDSELSSTDDVEIIVNSVVVNVCPIGSIDFNQYSLESYTTTEDITGTTSVSNDGSELMLLGNTWKRSNRTYTITANTILEFDFASTTQGEIHGLGFDKDQSQNNGATIFKFWGTQNWRDGINYTPKYSGNGEFQSYSIPEGNYYTGSGFHLAFVSDKDGGAANNNGIYRCIRIVEH